MDVSIVVCTYNRAKWLPSIIHQLVQQEFPTDGWEILIVDNNSADDTVEVVNSIIPMYSGRVRYFLEPRPGVTWARNRGASEASYPCVVFCDDDCIVDPSWVGNLIAGFDLASDVVAVGGLVKIQWERLKPPWLDSELEPYLGCTDYLGPEARLLTERERVVEFNLALKRDAWQRAGGFLGMEQFGARHCAAGEGLLLFENLRRQGGKIGYAPQALMYHCMHGRVDRMWMLQRVYWQGVADALMAALGGDRGSRPNRMGLIVSNCRRCAGHFLYGVAATFAGDMVTAMRKFAVAAAALGRLLGEVRLAGAWDRVERHEFSSTATESIAATTKIVE